MTADDALVTMMAVGVVLFVVCVSMAWTTYRRNRDADWRSRSNARVLREYQAISIHRPHYIITVEPTERTRREDHPTYD